MPGREEGLLRAVAAGVDEAIFVKDLEGRYLMVNEAAARVIGRPVEQVIGKDDTAFFPREIADRLREIDRRVLESGETIRIEEEAVTAAGRRTFLSSKSVYRNRNGEVVGVVGISQDVTERKRAE